MPVRKYRRRKECVRCGDPMPDDSYVEVRVMDCDLTTSETAFGARVKRWKARTRLTRYVCARCADELVEILKEDRNGH